MLENIALFNGLTEKMGFLQMRQRVISQNITQADTPEYRTHDVKKPDFRQSMAIFLNREPLNRGDQLSVASTNDKHFTHRQMLDRRDAGTPQRQTYEVAPVGNSVSIEEEMMKASQTAIDYQLITNIYTKNTDLLRTAMRR
jgi:flagellar basal-body rod protein FlgB